MIRTLAALSVFTAALFAQQNVSSEFNYHRVYAVVPLVGTGTSTDPQRPMLVPAPGASQTETGGRADLLGYQMQLSDNGKFALVEFVFQSPVSYHNFLAKAAATASLGAAVPVLAAIASDGSNLKALSANIAALTSFFESSVPGMKLMERGRVSEADIVSAFTALKASYTLGSNSVRPQ
jgi:hypothetical protein